MEELARKNPWLGLESYKEGEILYGRDEDIRDLSQCVLNDTETLLYGKSGIGKSSILNAGILPAARRSGYLPVVIRLSHKDEHPYLVQIHQAIINSIVSSCGNDLLSNIGGCDIEAINKEYKFIREVVARKNQDSESFYEYFHRHTFHNEIGERIKLLIIFDQFEEIFTLQEDIQKKKDFFVYLADLLNDIMPDVLQHNIEVSSENQLDIKVVSEENIETIFENIDLDFENSLTEYVTDNDVHFVFTIREDYLSEFEYYSATIPTLKQNRYALRPINEEQAAQIILRPIPGLIDVDVAKFIIEKITGSKDFKLDGIPEIEVDSAVLSLYLQRLYDAKEGNTITRNLVEQKGGKIIYNFYNEALSDISESTVDYLEDMLLNGKGRRDNITIYDAINEGGVSVEEIDILSQKKKILRVFNYAGELRIEFVHDILCPVVKEHKDERLQIKLLEEERIRQEQLQKQLLLEEETKRKEIERKAKEESDFLKAEAARVSKRNRRKWRIFVTLTFLVGVIVLGWWFLLIKDYHVDYCNFTTFNGWPIGLEEVKNSSTKEKLIVYYRLTRKGWLKRDASPFYKVEVLDANDNPTTNKFHETPIVGLLETEMCDEQACAFAKLQQETSYWVYSFGGLNFKEMARCTAYDLENNELYSISYHKDKTFESDDDNKYVQWAVFNDKDGKQMIVTGNGVDRMRQTVKNGAITGCLFFTELGTPQKNSKNVYGYQYEVDDSTHLIKKQYQVDKFGQKIDSTVLDYLCYKFGRISKTSQYEVQNKNKGEFIFKYKNFNDTIKYNESGHLEFGSFHINGQNFSKIQFGYGANGLLLFNKKYVNNSIVEGKEYFYTSTNKVDSISILEKGLRYTEKYAYLGENTTCISFWTDGKKMSKKCTNEFKVDELYYHKCVVSMEEDSLYEIETVSYYDTIGNLISSEYGPYAKYSRYRDKHTGNVKLDYFYSSDGEIIKSEWFDYDEYGNRIARAVAGIEGTPVRCDKWDWDNNCYYKMQFLKSFNDLAFTGMRGVNEFGEESYVVTYEEGCRYYIDYSELPLTRVKFVQDIDKIGVYKEELYGIGLSVLSKRYINENTREVPYLHLLSKHGEMFKSQCLSKEVVDVQKRMKDGDILLKVCNWHLGDSNKLLKEEWSLISRQGGEISVLRPNQNSYVELTFLINKGNLGAEYHLMPLTLLEQSRISNF